MHTRSRTFVGGLVSALLILPALLPTPAAAETSADAKAWIEKMAAIRSQGAFELDMEMTMGRAGQSPIPVSGLRGHLTQRDRTHMRMAMDIDSPAAAQSGGKMKMLMVVDGTTMWNEMDMGVMKQATKLDLEVMDKMAAEQGQAPGMNNFDPVSQMEQMTKSMDFEVVSVLGGEVTLRATMTAESSMSFAGAKPEGAEVVTLVLDEATAFPKRMQVGADPPLMTMTISNMKQLDAASLDPALFQYSPPEGMPVVDLAAMMQQHPNPNQ